MKREDAIALALAIGVPNLLGQASALLSYRGILGWYKRLRKPRWTPPNWLFGAVWPVLYAGQGVASWFVWKNNKAPGLKKNRNVPLALYGAQLVLNLIWQPIMFKFKRPDIALGDSAAMLGMATAATVAMAKNAGDKKGVVAGLMSPYVAWIAFATALNYKIWKDNPNAKYIDDSPAVAGTEKAGLTAADKATEKIKEAGEKVKGTVENLGRKAGVESTISKDAGLIK